jgi:hypothetical protein
MTSPTPKAKMRMFGKWKIDRMAIRGSRSTSLGNGLDDGCDDAQRRQLMQ